MSSGLNNSLLVLVVCLLVNQVFCLQDDTSEIADCDESFIPPQTNFTHSCRYRDLEQLYPPNLWRWLGGFGCYNYTLVGTRNITFPYSTCKIKHNGEYYPIFYTELGNYKILYDYTNELSRLIIKQSFIAETFFEKWITCSKEAEECCDVYMQDYSVYPTEEYPCPAIWDGWHCFKPTRAGMTAKEPCSTKAFLSNNSTCTLFAEKQCFSNGEWNQTSDTTTCIISTVQKKRHNFHIIVLSVSTALAIPAIVIFFAFPKLRILRVILHRNLLCAVVCRNIISIVVKSMIILEQLEAADDDDSVIKRNTVECRVLVFFENVAKNAIFTAMLVDGFYLHKLIVRVFAKNPKGYILHGVTVVFSIIPSLIWAIVKGIYSNDSCWLVERGPYHWIIDGYRLATLVANLILLIDILRVLWFKVAKSTDTTSYVRSNLRVTVFLLPLFGVHFLIVADTSIAGETCAAENAYYFATYSLEALQGVLIALGFCYLNSEVHRNIKTALITRFPQLRRRNNHSRMNTDISLVGNSVSATT